MADSTPNPTSNMAIAGGEEVHAGGLSTYKPGQGYYTRMGTVVGVSIISLLGILWLWEYMRAIKIEGVNPLYVSAGGAIVIGGIITFVMYYLVFVKPKTVDFLIATEAEMKKVNWSTRREVIGSTWAVVVTAIVLAMFCWALEIVFVAFFQWIHVLKS